MADKTFAQEAKAIMNKYKLRLGEKFDKGDPLALEAMNRELEVLKRKQEEVRDTEGASEQSIFQRGGLLPYFQSNAGIDAITSDLTTFTPDTLPGLPSEAIAAQTGSQAGPEGFTPFRSRVPWFGALSQGVSGIIANRQLNLPEYNYTAFTPTPIQANLVDYSRGREQLLRERDLANAIISRGARGTGSQASLMENILAGTTGTQRATGTAFNQSIENQGNVNAQIKNQVTQANAEQRLQAEAINQRNSMLASQVERENALINASRRDAQLGAVGDAITGYGRDLLAANQYDQMLQIMAPDNYKIGSSRDNLFRRIFQISPDMKINFLNTNDRSANI